MPHPPQQRQQQQALRQGRGGEVARSGRPWFWRRSILSPRSVVLLLAGLAMTMITTETHAFQQVLVSRSKAPTMTMPMSMGATSTALSAASSKKASSSGDGMPDLRALFDKIQTVSPLARHVMSSGSDALQSGLRGLAAVEDHLDKALHWKSVEKKPTGTVHQIDKLESFDGVSAPLFRFRASLEGPLVDGGLFGQYILDLDQRKKWDAQIEQVQQIHHLDALQDVFNLHLGPASSTLNVRRATTAAAASATSTAADGLEPPPSSSMNLGECVRLGVGYGQTKKSLGITEREQLFWFGMQEFGGCGAYILWGQEVQDDDSALWPEGSPRFTRAKSHLFSATLLPTSDTTFDVEYVLQLEIGGQIPKFLTSPVLVDTVKNLFKVASSEISSGIESLWKQKRQDQVMSGRELLLMTP